MMFLPVREIPVCLFFHGLRKHLLPGPRAAGLGSPACSDEDFGSGVGQVCVPGVAVGGVTEASSS